MTQKKKQDTHSSQEMVITRFPPSPTGSFHVGGARTALFNYLFAKKMNGEMALRFEDTDKERSEKKYEKEIVEALQWLGIDDYLPPVRQSERGAIYERHLQKMIDAGSAYVSEEEGREEERSSVIRFRNPNKKVAFDDLVRGEISFDTTELGNFVIAKSIDEPLYHLAVVVDDHETEVTHVIRGEDHISNTPRQILIQEAIGAERPVYAHLPLILGPDKSKLSKRHGADSLLAFREKGYLADALFNYLALLGWHPKDDREVLSRDEIIAEFSLEDISKGGAVFDLAKLNWLNRQYIGKLSEHDIAHHTEEFLPKDIKKLPEYSFERLQSIAPVIRERIEKFEDVKEMAEEGELEYYFERPDYFAKNLLWKKDKQLNTTAKHLEKVIELLSDIPEDEFNSLSIKSAVWNYATEEGRGSVLWPMRYALCGMDRSPDPFTLAEIFGKVETLARLSLAHDKIRGNSKK